MKNSGFLLALSFLMIAPALSEAQIRGRNSQGIPPGQMPRPGECRVWIDGVAPGKQPRPTYCRTAEEVVSRTRNARVIYGSENDSYGNDRYGNNGVYNGRDVYDRSDRAIIRKSKPGQGMYNSAATEQGYRDGYARGREDGRDNDRFDPTRQSDYRSATRGYNSRYGNRDEYRNEYRKAFEEGYARGYDETERGAVNNSGARRRFPR